MLDREVSVPILDLSGWVPGALTTSLIQWAIAEYETVHARTPEALRLTHAQVVEFEGEVRPEGEHLAPADQKIPVGTILIFGLPVITASTDSIGSRV